MAKFGAFQRDRFNDIGVKYAGTHVGELRHATSDLSCADTLDSDGSCMEAAEQISRSTDSASSRGGKERRW